MHVCWLRSVTRITYLSKLIGIPSLAAYLKLELFRVWLIRDLAGRAPARKVTLGLRTVISGHQPLR
ncbi:hypothetical protein B5S52_12345 [Pectobacterium brasiliense]|nr:hypothetical protein B5S52_12345 [Pectobacterium brasiliense]